MVPIKLVNQKIRDRNQRRWLRSNAFDISICCPGVLTNEARIFELAEDYEDPALRDALADVKVWREKRSKGVGTGEWELIPYFWTKPTAKTPSPIRSARASSQARRPVAPK